MRFVLMFLLIALHALDYSSCGYLEVNDLCEISYGGVGVCLDVEKCPGADGYNREICSYDGVDLIVCCEQTDQTEGICEQTVQAEEIEDPLMSISVPKQSGDQGMPVNPFVPISITKETNTNQRYLEVNDFCQTSYGEVGICLDVEHCPGADGYNMEHCSYDGVDLIVCCEQTEHAEEVYEQIEQSEEVGNQPMSVPLPISEKAGDSEMLDNGPMQVSLPIPIPIISQSSDYGMIANQKCEEYKTTSIPTTTTTTTTELPPNATFSSSDLFIIRGVDANPLEFPHMAILGFGPDKIHWICGGSLISENFILTAAHCIQSRYGTVRKVNLGVHQLNFLRTVLIQSFDVKNITIHPNYRFGQDYHDIALIELDRIANIRTGVRPACLQTNKNIPADIFVATGWGATELYGRSSDILQKVNLTFVTYNNCSKYYQPQRKLPNGLDDESQICADGGSQRADTCQGDSGGPLQIKDSNEPLFTVVGITSFGIKCAIVPAVYTRVSNYIPWIESIVWPN